MVGDTHLNNFKLFQISFDSIVTFLKKFYSIYLFIVNSVICHIKTLFFFFFKSTLDFVYRFFYWLFYRPVYLDSRIIIVSTVTSFVNGMLIFRLGVSIFNALINISGFIVFYFYLLFVIDFITLYIKQTIRNIFTNTIDTLVFCYFS